MAANKADCVLRLVCADSTTQWETCTLRDVTSTLWRYVKGLYGRGIACYVGIRTPNRFDFAESLRVVM